MDIMKIFDRLYPLNRAVTGEGLRETLKVINEYVPLNRVDFPSGDQCFSWQVPQEWWITEAYIENSKGERMIDFADHNLHILAYSGPFEGWVTREELLEHVYSLPQQADAIPYITSVYKERWGFCMTHQQKCALLDENYYVKIDSGFIEGSLNIGEGLIKGQSDREVTLFTYTGHPSMANDQLSGILAQMLVYEWLLENKDELHYTYRILFCPETIGTAAYLSKHLAHMQQHFHAGFMLTFLGDSSPIRYKKSLSGDTEGDRAAINIMRRCEVLDFDADGSDERHFNAPGIDLPFGTFMRAGSYGYESYHTSLDDRSVISEEKLVEAAETVIRTIRNLETNQRIVAAYKGFEPKLDVLGLYPTLGKKFDQKADVTQMLRLWRFSSSGMDLIDIGNRMNVDAFELKKSLEVAQEINLIKRGKNDNKA